MRTTNSAGAWTEIEKDQLVNWRDYGFSFVLIGGMLGRSPNACRQMYHVVTTRGYLATPRPWTDEEDDRLRTLSQTKMSNAQIAKRLNRTKAAVESRKTTLGISARQKGETLCWRCKHSSGKHGFCSWFVYGKYEPVEGWDAEKRYILTHGELTNESYLVRRCPQFEKEVRA